MPNLSLFSRRLLLVLLILIPLNASAQRFAISTNVADWANLGTVNLNMGVGVAKHFSIEAGGKYNGWSFSNHSGMPIMNKQTCAYAGLRYWIFYINSGWWVSARGQYKDYTQTGIWRIAVEDGKRAGGCLNAGYSYLLAKHINLDFGLGVWGGKQLEYTLKHCSNCNETMDSGSRMFFDIDNINIAISFIF